MEPLQGLVMYLLMAAGIILAPWLVAKVHQLEDKRKQAKVNAARKDIQKRLATEDRELHEKLVKLWGPPDAGERIRKNAAKPRIVAESPKPPKQDKPTITINAETSRNRKNPEMAESDFQKDKTLLEQFADATHDVEMLQVFLQSMLEEPGTSGLMLQQVIQRSIARAEAEAERLKHRYEHNEER